MTKSFVIAGEAKQSRAAQNDWIASVAIGERGNAVLLNGYASQ
jgi:hypothetical protein